jgi:DNA polymerase-1
MIRIEPALAAARLSALMLLQVHDELVFEAPQSEVEPTMALAAKVMEGAAEPAVHLSVPLKVDAHSGDNWDAAH